MTRFIVGRRPTVRRPDGDLRVTDRRPRYVVLQSRPQLSFPGMGHYDLSVRGKVIERIALTGGAVVARVLPDEAAEQLADVEARITTAQHALKALQRERQDVLDGAIPNARLVSLDDADPESPGFAGTKAATP